MWYVLVLGKFGFHVSFDFDDPIDWKEMAQLLRKKRGIIFQLIWQTGRRERPPTPTANGQGNNKNIPPFPEQRCRKSIMSKKKSEKLFKAYPSLPTKTIELLFSSPNEKRFKKYEEIKIPPLFLREINELPLLPNFYFDHRRQQRRRMFKTFVLLLSARDLLFFLFFFWEKDGRQLFSFLISLLFSKNFLTDVAAFFVSRFLSQYFYPSRNKISHKNSHYTIRE